MEKTISTLELLSGGSQVLSTKQLAKSLSMNYKVISKMRKEGRFPIKHKLIGTKIVYTISSVAKYLESDEPEQALPIQKKSIEIEPLKRRSSNKAQLPNLSRKMLMLGFMSALKTFNETIEETLLYCERKMQNDSLAENLIKNIELENIKPIKKV